jgi:hypothetical protein
MKYITDTKHNRILEFIDNFFTAFMQHASACGSYNAFPSEPLRMLYRTEYCWHFAHMLKTAFDRGTVCWTAPYSHVIWMDADGTAYDCEGICKNDSFYLIPEEYIPANMLQYFKHMPDRYVKEATREQLIKIVKTYCEETGCEYRPEIENYFPG